LSTGSPGLRRSLTLFDTTLLVIGGIIGTGVFFNTSNVAHHVHTPQLILGVWLLGGFIALIGALSYAELSAMMPEVGGEYAFLREGWGRLVAFLYGWTMILVICSGALAAVSMKFAESLLAIVSLPIGPKTLALASLWICAAINVFGVKPGAIVQNIFTVGKLAALAALVFLGLSSPHVQAPAAVAVSHDGNLLLAIGAALAPVLFSYGGWQSSTYTAAEIRDPSRTLPRALIAGIIVVIAVYLSAAVVYLRTLPVEAISTSNTLATDVARVLMGERGAQFISLAIVISTFGFINMTILTAPRVFYAMALDGLLVGRAAYVHPKYHTPVAVLLFFSAWASLMLLTGSYDSLLSYVTFGDWIFFGLTMAALFRLRHTRPDAIRPYKAWGYPVLPALFVIVAFSFVILNFIANQPQTSYGAALILAGIPVYYMVRK
jgi:APA family basic amino acid/polyamine antiporter